MCFDVLIIFLIFLILRRVLRDIIINAHKSCKLSTILVRFSRNFNSLDRFFKNTDNIKFYETLSSGKQVVP